MAREKPLLMLVHTTDLKNGAINNVCKYEWLHNYLAQKQRTQSTGFRQNVQKWNYTYLQNYQMVKFHSKVGFL